MGYFVKFPHLEKRIGSLVIGAYKVYKDRLYGVYPVGLYAG